MDDFDRKSIKSSVISRFDWNNERMGQEPFEGVVPGDVWFDYKRLFCFVTSVESERRRYVLLRSPLDFLCSRLRDSKNVFILCSRAIDPLGFNSRDKCARQHSKLQCASFDPAYSRNVLGACFDFLACMHVRADDNSPCVQIPYF